MFWIYKKLEKKMHVWSRFFTYALYEKEILKEMALVKYHRCPLIAKFRNLISERKLASKHFKERQGWSII